MMHDEAMSSSSDVFVTLCMLPELQMEPRDRADCAALVHRCCQRNSCATVTQNPRGSAQPHLFNIRMHGVRHQANRCCRSHFGFGPTWAMSRVLYARLVAARWSVSLLPPRAVGVMRWQQNEVRTKG